MIEWLLKYPLSVIRDADVVLTNPLSGLTLLVATVVILALLVASAVLGARTHGLGAGRRLVLGALLALLAVAVLGVLMMPALRVETLKPGANRVAVVLDASLSMSFPAGERSRLAAAQDALEGVTADLMPLADLDLYAFAEGARRIDTLGGVSATGSQSRLAESLETVLAGYSGAPLAAIVVATDGADTGAQPDLTPLIAAGVPVHVIGVGARALAGEVELVDVAMPVEVAPGTQVDALATVSHGAAGSAVLRVREAGRLVTAVTLDLPADRSSSRVRIPFTSGREGIRDLEFEVVPVQGDVLEANNRLQRLLTISPQVRKVLYVEGEPRWEYKFIRRALDGDEVLDFKSLLQTTDRKLYRQGVADAQDLASGFPESRDALFEFDLLMLGSLAAAELSEAQHAMLEAFVSERGGSLLVLGSRNSLAAGGWQGRPLAAVLPVTVGGAAAPAYVTLTGQARVARDGAQSALTLLPDAEGGDPWETLPPLGDYLHLGALKPAAQTLLELVVDGSAAKPLLVQHHYGLGTAAVLATGSTWRWQTRTDVDDPRHQIFWRQLARQRAEEALRERDVAVTVEADVLQIRAALRDELQPQDSPIAGAAATQRPTALITAPDGQERLLELSGGAVHGVFEASLDATQAGVHRVDVTLPDGERITRFARLGSRDREYFRPVQNVALLQRLAATTAGAYWTPESSGGLAEALTFGSAGIREVKLLPLWDAPAVFALLVLLKSGEWLLRRRWRRL